MSPGGPMKRQEILELMKLRGWTQAELARRLEITEGAVSRWLTGENPPTGPARILMRLWLSEARDEVRKQPA
jgi:transcriptional regulator with XRE-family HTH domain